MEKPGLVYIISNIDKALAFEWLACSEALRSSYALQFILLGPAPGYLHTFLCRNHIPVLYLPYKGKGALPVVIWTIWRYLRKQRPHIVHTHLFDANLAGLLAARLAGVPKRIYTRHHATLHHVYFPRAVYYDKAINRLATAIVAISGNVAEVLEKQEGVSPEKLRLIHHGFKLDQLSAPDHQRLEAVRSRHQIPLTASPVIGVIARYTHWKGIQHIIPAFQKLRSLYPEAHLLLANAKGDGAGAIKAQLAQLPAHAYTEIAFEKDIPALYGLLDVYVHTPIDAHSEAFGQTYVEALAVGVPSVFTLSGVAPEFIRHEHNALVVPFQDTEAIYHALVRLLADAALRQKLVTAGRASVQEFFTFEQMEEKLLALYAGG
ncbi:glycosyltransferase family 4 protein [Cesiribacter andamanensis]|uniref:Mannosylfructose-phosphate synthase n=1 Tax=Cesiribacter andamanensis AMV16 TaxID=1279009 RepID=M7N4W3_9BACT|nr:glycosyltransferase family 4 protein [Cesiribacter andamanensis]EMR03698.1 Mannosylfructose-phosphate synthase [Cesiribacter andamanensis AMV16]